MDDDWDMLLAAVAENVETDFRFNLPKKIRLLLEAAKLDTAEKVLKASFVNLEKLGLIDDEVWLVKIAASKNQAKPFTTASKTPEHRRISFFCSKIDAITRHGLPTRGVTEIYGEAGSGKTQICLQLALNVQMPIDRGGLEKSAVYICTEKTFPSKRLSQLVKYYSGKYKITNLLDNVLIEHVLDEASLQDCIMKRLPFLFHQRSIDKKHIGLVVIDSIAGVYRHVGINAIARADSMRKLVLQLQSLSDAYESAILCVNQATVNVNSDKVQPSLGLAWSNLVTSRILIRKTDDFVTPNRKDVEQENQNFQYAKIRVRSFEIIFSPDLPRRKAEFIVTDSGIRYVYTVELKEIDHLLLDANKKIDLAFISGKWDVSFMESESILQNWLDGYKGDKKILINYLIRGIDLSGNCVITVVPENKLDRVERFCPQFTKTLYSVEVETPNDKQWNIAEKPINKFITLRLQPSSGGQSSDLSSKKINKLESKEV